MKKRINKFAPNGFYCLTGNSSANNLFFEDKEDQQLFLRLLDRFLGELIILHSFSSNPTGWVLFFTVKDKTTIIKEYTEFRKQSRKSKVRKMNLDAGLMLSEHFRYFLSAYVKQSNFRHKRHGSRVHSKMEKYVFETMKDLDEEIEKMKKMEETNLQRPKYRPNMAYYLVDKQLKRDSMWRHSFVGLGGEMLMRAVVPCFRRIMDRTDVLRQLIQSTWNYHFGPNNKPLHPPQFE